jgi:protease-4
MFSRRHPFLFSILVFSGIVSVTIIVLGLVITLGFGKLTDFGELRATGKEKIGVVELSGVITDSRKTTAHLKQFREDKTIKAIVLRINSPGGSVGPAQEIYREIIKTKQKKKMVASMGALAASGGYYVAAGADKIMANPGTITGSIGVIMLYTNFEQLLEKIGLVPVVVKSGQYKDIGSPARTMSLEEKQLLQQVTDGIHRQFISDVAEGRGLTIDKVQKVADGRIFTGEAAVNMGLVDRLGNMEDAVQWAGRLAGVEGEVEAVYARDRAFSLLKYFSETTLKILTEKVLFNQLYAGYLYLPDE